MYYVYILQSINFVDQFYVGYTEDINNRLIRHNSGFTSHTSKYRPWKIITYLVFTDKVKALSFEEYLKSGSGRVFKHKRLL